jgi:hypothetical protein
MIQDPTNLDNAFLDFKAVVVRISIPQVPQAKKPWLFGLALAFSGFGSSWLWRGLGFIGAKAKAVVLPELVQDNAPLDAISCHEILLW